MSNTNTTMGKPEDLLYENQQLIDQKKRTMSPEQFVVWFKGFIEGSHNYNLTPSGWDKVKDTLSSVSQKNESTFTQTKKLLND